MSKYLDGDGLKNVWDRFQSDLSKKANASFETYGPAEIATVDIAAEGTGMEPVSEIAVTQAGEGTPSPDNIRPISGWDEIKLTQNGEVFTMRFGETVYGGTYNWKTGELTITNKYFELKVDDMNGTATYPGWRRLGDDILECFPIDINSNETNMICNVGTVVAVNTTLTNRILSFPSAIYNLTQNDWNEQYGGLVCQFVFPLLEPYTIQLMPQEFVASSVSDVFSSDCGNTSVTFQIDVKKYIDKKIETVLKA